MGPLAVLERVIFLSRLLDEVLERVAVSGEAPDKILCRGKQLRVLMVLDRWYDTGCWWEGESPKLFFRLQLEGEKVWEIYQDLSGRQWRLYKIYD